MKTIIVFNAPPNSGKDISCDYLVKNYGAYHTYFKKRLYEVAAMVAGINLEDMIKLATDRIQKEKPQSCFVVNETKYSPRQWLIHVSENVVKPLLGKEYFGQHLSKEIWNANNGLIVVSDGGFKEELLPLKDDPEFLMNPIQAKIHVVQLGRTGRSFVNDSRTYFDTDWLDEQEIQWSIIINNSTLEDLYEELDYIMQQHKFPKKETK